MRQVCWCVQASNSLLCVVKMVVISFVLLQGINNVCLYFSGPVIQACCSDCWEIYQEGKCAFFFFPISVHCCDLSLLSGLSFCSSLITALKCVINFLQCKPEYKVPGLYVVDSIVRQSRHQFGADKDVFGPRFTKNITGTFENLCLCPTEDRVRVNVFWL